MTVDDASAQASALAGPERAPLGLAGDHTDAAHAPFKRAHAILRRHLADRLPELYARARHDAEGSLRDHGEQDAAEALPVTCPYTLDQITGDWLP